MSAGCDARWSSYADYARLRTRGLRKDALAAAHVCAGQVVASGAEQDFTRWLFAECVRPGIPLPRVLPHQLCEIALPALWTAHADGQSWATQALITWFPAAVMASRDYCTDAVRALLSDAVAAHPDDEFLRELLARHLLTWVRHDTVDLAHGRYDGDPQADLDRLAEAHSLVNEGDPLIGEIAAARTVVLDWIAGGQPSA